MKIAIIGGNLLGCATAADLAIVQEHDERKFTATEPFDVTLFEKTDRLGGNSLKAVRIDDDLHVEVGTYRTLPLSHGTFLESLVGVANGHQGTFGIGKKRIAIPGSTAVHRGRPGAAPVRKPWTMGTYGRIMRSFAVWDWRQESYHLVHKGWPVFDLLARLFDNAIWRSVALSGVIWATRNLQQTETIGERAVGLVQFAVMLLFFIMSPREVMKFWQANYSFWATTLPLLVRYGITPAISRGSTIGFVKHLVDANQKNSATVSVSLSLLLARTGLEPYVRATGDDYVRSFHYNRKFVDRFIAPTIAIANAGTRLSNISSLASHLGMLDADQSNSDAIVRFCTIGPQNATLCEALLDAARATTEVDVRLETAVSEIRFNAENRTYDLMLSDGTAETFDGIALCATPKDGELRIDSQRGASLSELLGYERDQQAVVQHLEKESEFHEQNPDVEREDPEPPVATTACSHIAVVVGKPNASFFRFASEKQIPDLIQISYAPGFSQFERVREGTKDKLGVYSVICGGDFVTDGLFDEMFEQGADLRYFEPRAVCMYSHTSLSCDMDIDDSMPFMVLGNRFVYVAALESLAKHPEMDALAAVNAASMFSSAVKWSSGDEDEDEDEEEDDGEDKDEDEPTECAQTDTRSDEVHKA